MIDSDGRFHAAGKECVVNRTGQVPMRVGTLEELLAVAAAMEREAAARYRELSALMSRQGDVLLAAQFEALAEAEDRHAARVVDRGHALLGYAPDPRLVRWDPPAGPHDAGLRPAVSCANQPPAFALRNDNRPF